MDLKKFKNRYNLMLTLAEETHQDAQCMTHCCNRLNFMQVAQNAV